MSRFKSLGDGRDILAINPSFGDGSKFRGLFSTLPTLTNFLNNRHKPSSPYSSILNRGQHNNVAPIIGLAVDQFNPPDRFYIAHLAQIPLGSRQIDVP